MKLTQLGNFTLYDLLSSELHFVALIGVDLSRLWARSNSRLL